MKYNQHGQVLPIGLVMLALSVMGALVLYNTGQVATDKMSLANTADAAAYSGSQWQARALNFQSYSNRAMVANQVSIAQAVTLQSWVAYGAVASENISTVLRPVPVANVLAAGLETGLLTVERVMTPVTNVLLRIVDMVNRGLSMAQQAMFVSTFVATPDVVRAVVDQSDERFTLNTAFSGIGIATNLNGWRTFTDGFDDEDISAMNERAALVNESRDDFTRQRDWKFFKEIWFPTTVLLWHRVYREGKTELIRVDGVEGEGTQWEWKAKDTASLHSRLFRWRGMKPFEVPIGWAEAFANTRDSPDTIEPGACTMTVRYDDCARFLSKNRIAEFFADRGVRSPVKQLQTQRAMRGYTGLQAFRSLSEATITEGTAHLQLKVEVALPDDDVSSTAKNNIGGDFSAPVVAPGKRISSVSVAEVFYQRPDVNENPGQALEKANAYNPYWSARLAPITKTDRLLAFSLRQLTSTGSRPEGLPQIPSQLANYEATDTNTQSAAAGFSDAETLAVNPYGVTDQSTTNGQDTVAIDPSSVTGSDFDTAAAEFDNTDLSGLGDSVDRELNAAISSATGDVLSSGLDDPFSSDTESLDGVSDRLGNTTEQRVSTLTTSAMTTQYDTVVNVAETTATTRHTEYVGIRDQVSSQFGVAVDTAQTSPDSEVVQIQGEIKRLEEELELAPADDPTRSTLTADLAVQNTSLETALGTQRTDLAQQLIEIFAEATDVHVMSLDEALATVDEWLLGDTKVIDVPWDELEGDDDD